MGFIAMVMGVMEPSCMGNPLCLPLVAVLTLLA
jgi:hypothetical protein